MSRARLAAPLAVALAGLALAGAAAAALPTVPGSALGDGQPLRAYASVSPLVHLFGDSITARVDVIADTKWVDPSRLRVQPKFDPYRPVTRPSVDRTGTGRFVEMTWRWTLRCLTPDCVPREPPSNVEHVFQFQPAHIEYLNESGAEEYGVDATFPPVKVLSQLSPDGAQSIAKKKLLWRFAVFPVIGPTYRVSPQLLFWLLFGFGLAFALAGTALAGGRVLASVRLRARAASGSALDQALALFFWAREHGDDTLQRKALERVADELGTDELSARARALAWSPETPAGAEVQVISEQAHAGEESP
ncbi:MAG TPA: hypothetical protein VHD91_07250 [Gaiellaceae bacterium]|nr:hypothetical protein [Gaiellaceae bacterium]